MKNLVVVASYGVAHALRFLEKAGNKYEVLIIRTDLAKDRVRGAGLDYTPYKGYDTGAYLWAYWNHPADNYLFIQDSLIPQTEDYGDIIFDKLKRYDVVALAGFPFPMWDSPWQEASARNIYENVSPARGIFGPNFGIRREALDKLADEGLLPMPALHKENAQGKEREWAMAFELAELDVHFLHEWSVHISDLYPFTKIYGARA